ncbi:MAG: hypothetical protein U1D97_12375 [Desulfuromonadales bacterium]|nr:hypothetical protein [Desulfuromonadales bacterium]
MVDPNDLNPDDLDDGSLIDFAQGYIDNNASAVDWMEFFSAVRDLGYHVGYRHGKEDVEKGVYGTRAEYPLVAEEAPIAPLVQLETDELPPAA